MLHYQLPRCAGVCAWLLFSLSLLAQQPTGTLTLRDGTVLVGAVKINTEQVSVQPTGGPAQTFATAQVKAVRLTDADGSETNYRVYTVQYDTSPHRTEQLLFDAAPRYKTSAVLLEQLHSGAWTLYRQIDASDRTHFFVQKGDSTPIELLKKRYYTASRDTVLNNNRYQKQLAYYFSDCPDASRDGLSAPYTQRALERVLKLYDRCKGVTAVVQNRPKTKISVGLVGGGYYVQAFKKTTDFNGKQVVRTGQNLFSWQAGVQMETFLQRSRNRWSYTTDLQVAHFDARYVSANVFVDPLFFAKRYEDYYHDRYWTLRWTNLVRRQFTLNRRQRWYVGGGISASFNTKTNREIKTIERVQYVAVDSFYTYPPKLRQPADMGFVANAGYQFGRFGVEARFDWLFGNLLFSQSTIYPVRRSSTFVLLSYKLNK